MKVLFLGLVFFTGSYALQTLKTVPKHFDVVILECATEQSPSIAKMLTEIARSWIGSFRHILYERNLIGGVYRRFLIDSAEELEQYDYIVTSDMDVEIDNLLPWEKCFEMIANHKRPGVMSLVCSDVNHTEICQGWQSILIQNVDISENGLRYGTPNNNNNTGWQCIIFPVSVAKRFFVESQVDCVDSVLGTWLRQNELCWIVLADYKVKHLMWDAYSDLASQAGDVQKYIAWKNAAKESKGHQFWIASLEDIQNTPIMFDIKLNKPY